MATTFKSAILESKLTVNMELGGDNVVGTPAVIDDLNDVVKIDSGTTPDGAYAFTDDLPMTGSAVTIDLLDALVDMEGNTITLAAGQKVRAYKFRNPSTNANNITVTFGATNAYLLAGAAFCFVLTPGQFVQGYCASGSPVIDATHTNIDCTGTNGQNLEYVLVIG